MSADLIKDALRSAAGLSSTAKLVALCEAFGLTDKEELETLLDTRPSTLREAKRALKIQRQKSSDDGKPAPEIQRSAENPSQTLEIQRQDSSVPSRAHATKESPSEIVILDSNPLLSPTPFDLRVTLQKGRIVLCPEVRAEWVAEFGDEKDLDLALITAAAYVQPNSMRPLETQVSAQLARAVRDKRASDKRYAAAAAHRQTSKPTASASPPAIRPKMRPMTAEEIELHRNAGIF